MFAKYPDREVNTILLLTHFSASFKVGSKLFTELEDVVVNLNQETIAMDINITYETTEEK